MIESSYSADFTRGRDPKYKQMEARLKTLMAFIVKYKIEHDGNSPTLRELCAAIDTKSTSLVTYYLDELVKRGQIARDKNDTRSIRVIGGKWQPPARMANLAAKPG